MKLHNLMAFTMLLMAAPLRAKELTHEFKIDFLCCGEYVNYTSPAYSNAMLKAVLPCFSNFARTLNLPLHVPISMLQVQQFLPPHLIKVRGRAGGSGTLKDGTVFAFEDGHISLYESPHCYFKLQNPTLISKFYGPLNMTKAQAVDLARSAIKKLGYTLEDVMADFEPDVPPLQYDGTNVIPRYRIQWLDPRSRGTATEIEVNASKKSIESIRFNYIVALKLPGPLVDVEPDPLPPGHPWRAMNDMANDINHEYAYRLVPVVFQAAENWVRKLNLNLKLPITTNQVQRFYCSNNGGSPYVELTLTNNWRFVYRVNDIDYCGSPRRFFESDNLPFRAKDYAGKWTLTEVQAIELARRTVAKLGHSASVRLMSGQPVIHRPTEIKGMSTVPRLWLEWVYPSPDKPREQWVEVEVDCNKGTVEMVHFDDVRLWDKIPDLGVPIGRPKAASASSAK